MDEKKTEFIGFRSTERERQQIEDIRQAIRGNSNLTYTDSEIIRMSVDYLHAKLCYQREKPNPQAIQYK